MSEKGIILASGSPRRRKLLKEMGLKFTVIQSRVKEDDCGEKPSATVKRNALKKALFVSGLETVAKKHANAVIIGADTMVVLKKNGLKKVLGKPKSFSDAERILASLSGTTHTVYTGLAVIDSGSGKILKDYETSRVTMRKLSRRDVERAVKKHMDKAGAYGIQEKGDRFVKAVRGPVDNVVGLPCGKLLRMLRKFIPGLKIKLPAVGQAFI